MPVELRVNWAGTSLTGPGVSVLHARTSGGSTTVQCAQALSDRARAFFDAVKALVPAGVTWSFPSECTELDTTTGQLIGVHPVTPPADVVSTGAVSTLLRPIGARVDWLTTAIVNGRRLRGRTYLVPLTVGSFDGSGSIATTPLGTMETAATAYKNTGLFTASQPAVWSRTHGILADISGSNVPDFQTVMRSRRD